MAGKYKRIADTRGDYIGPDAGDDTKGRWVKKGSKAAKRGIPLPKGKEKRWDQAAAKTRAQTTARRIAKKGAADTVAKAVAKTKPKPSPVRKTGSRTMS